MSVKTFQATSLHLAVGAAVGRLVWVGYAFAFRGEGAGVGLGTPYDVWV